MDGTHLQFFRILLKERVRSLLESADAEQEALTRDEPLEASVLDFSEDTQTEFALRLRDRERVLLNKLRAAITRLDDGDYGSCTTCGTDIEIKRLVARPTASHCLDCRSSELPPDPILW